MPEGEHIPQGVACASCKYDLAGLAWGVPCPECGYRAPTTYPTDALREAHPRFIRSTSSQLRSLFVSDMVLLSGLALVATAYTIAVLLYPTSHRVPVELLLVLGAILLLLGFLAGLVISGTIVRKHRFARATLDQPTRKSVAKAYWWCVGPTGIAIVLTLATGGIAGFLLLIAIPISVASAGVLAFCLFEHTSSIIKRCGVNPSWTPFELVLGYGSILVFAMVAVSIGVLIQASLLLVLLGLAMLVVVHAKRLRVAQRCVGGVLAEVHTLESTSADLPPESPRS